MNRRYTVTVTSKRIRKFVSVDAEDERAALVAVLSDDKAIDWEDDVSYGLRVGQRSVSSFGDERKRVAQSFGWGEEKKVAPDGHIFSPNEFLTDEQKDELERKRLLKCPVVKTQKEADEILATGGGVGIDYSDLATGGVVDTPEWRNLVGEVGQEMFIPRYNPIAELPLPTRQQMVTMTHDVKEYFSHNNLRLEILVDHLLSEIKHHEGSSLTVTNIHMHGRFAHGREIHAEVSFIRPNHKDMWRRPYVFSEQLLQHMCYR